ncbi:MAG: FAD-binding oxidoreductase [Rhodobacteraceae bacterium]|nr:FAD-binding oxidoreductase [Paracoccaceae bacterium]
MSDDHRNDEIAANVTRRRILGTAGGAFVLPSLSAGDARAASITPDTLLKQLRGVLDDEGVLTGDKISPHYLQRRQVDLPIAVVRPQSTAETSAVMKICHAAGQPVVPLGGNSGLVRGTQANTAEIILALDRMDKIETVNVANRSMTVGAGVVLADAQNTAAENGFLLPLNMGSRGEATIGGMIATNAGGEEVVRYGMTRESVLGLEVVLADGTVISSMNRMIKNNAGYDLKHMFIGSEGTLGIVTRAVMRLRAKPDGASTALLAVADDDGVLKLLRYLERALAGTLTSFEIMWSDYDQFVRKYTPYLPSPLKAGYTYYVIVEVTGSDAVDDLARFKRVIENGRQSGLIADAAVADDEKSREEIWALREQAGAAFSELGPFWGYDVSLPIGDMAEYGRRVKAEVTVLYPEATLLFLGHVGDGNLHIIAAPGSRAPDVKKAVDDVVYGAIRDLGGSVSAEHGIGLEKKNYLAWSRTPEEIALMRNLKAMLDPKGILNPGKLI